MNTASPDTHSESSVTGDGGHVHPFWRFLYLLVAPVRGWKRIKNARYSPEYFARSLFFPLLAFMSAASFMAMLYCDEATLAHTLQTAICLFVAGFAGYYAVVVLARTFLPIAARIKIDSRFGKVYVMTCMSVLALAISIYELVPGIGMLFLVAPIYAAYLMVKGVRYLRVPDQEVNPTAILMTLLQLGTPMAIYFMLELLMPSAA